MRKQTEFQSNLRAGRGQEFRFLGILPTCLSLWARVTRGWRDDRSLRNWVTRPSHLRCLLVTKGTHQGSLSRAFYRLGEIVLGSSLTQKLQGSCISSCQQPHSQACCRCQCDTKNRSPALPPHRLLCDGRQTALPQCLHLSHGDSTQSHPSPRGPGSVCEVRA